MYPYSSSHREMDTCLHLLAAQNMSVTVLSSIVHSQMQQQNTLLSTSSQRNVFFNGLCNKLLLPTDTNCCLPRDNRSPAIVLTVLILLICGYASDSVGALIVVCEVCV